MSYRDYDTLIINGKVLKGEAILDFCRESQRPDLLQLGSFVGEWLDKSPVIILHTSGSTGIPSTVLIRKDQMLQSAAMTARFFQFKKGQTALLCLPTSYIAGKMMAVRALLCGLNLICIPPSGNPLEELPAELFIDFAPLTPMQLFNAKDSRNIKNILLGGGAVSSVLERKIKSMSPHVYHGYGMTETLSHVALRRINGVQASAVYRALNGIRLELDERDCLIINAPFLDEPVITNDAAELISSDSFIWKGRIDFVINSGGIKLFPEMIESKISEIIQSPFFIAGLPDERFGEKVSLFIEGEYPEESIIESIRQQLSLRLDKIEMPRQILFLKTFERSTSGKIRRPATLEKYFNSL